MHFDPHTGLRALVAIHRERSGRGCGGIRFRSYRTEEDALNDVLRLSEAMTYKCVLAGLPMGGAKSVVMAPSDGAPNVDLLHAMGDVVASYGGTYVSAPDMGIGTAELRTIAERTDHVVGFRHEAAPYTARGAMRAIEAVARWTFDQEGVTGLRIGVQGVGNVGRELARLLIAGGADVAVSDVDETRTAQLANELGATVVPAEDIMGRRGDILVPAAMGGVLDADSIAGLQVRAVVGPANNQLATVADGAALRARGIDFVPDFVASAGGVIAGVHELEQFDQDAVLRQVDRIAETTGRVLEHAARIGLDTTAGALALAKSILDEETESSASIEGLTP